MYLHLLTVLVQLSFIFDSTILVKKELRTVKKKTIALYLSVNSSLIFSPNDNMYLHSRKLEGGITAIRYYCAFFQEAHN